MCFFAKIQVALSIQGRTFGGLPWLIVNFLTVEVMNGNLFCEYGYTLPTVIRPHGLYLVSLVFHFGMKLG